MIFLNAVVVVFPILVYLIFSCFNLLTNNKCNRYLFIITIVSSMYFNILYGTDKVFLIFSNIPIIISYLKKESNLALILSIVLLIYMYSLSDNIIISSVKYIGYFIIYLFMSKKLNSSLYIFIVSIFQGCILFLEYLDKVYVFDEFIEMLFVTIIIYFITVSSLCLFDLADKISMMYATINRNKRELELKNSLFKLTHEVKNPIAVCKGYLDMIDISNKEKSSKYLEIIKSEIDRSLNIMNDFTEYNKIKIVKEEFDMSLLLDSIYKSFSLLTKNKNIKFNYINNYDSIYVNGDYHRIEQVFVNVIKNSIEAISSSGIIDMSVSLNKDDVSILIHDNGKGMSEMELANIKEMFYTTKKEGTGLGVSLSNEIIILHDGEMQYDSSLGLGTTCTITIPRLGGVYD